MAANRKNDDMRKNALVRNRRRIMAVIAIAVIFGLLAISLIIPDRTFSPDENRDLQRFPKPTVSSIASGSYFRDLNSYMTDQFAFRDAWLGIHYLKIRVTGGEEAGGVLLGKKGMLLAKPTVPDEKAVKNSEDAIRTFASDHSDLRMTMMLVPCAAAVMPEHLPNDAPVRNQEKDITDVQKSLEGSNVTFVNPTDTLKKHKSEYIYYKTDHHWTTLGAYYAYQDIAESMGLSKDPGKYTKYLVSDTFRGTLSSQSGNHFRKDEIYVFARKNSDVEYYVSYPDLKKTTATVYDTEKLKEKDQYQVFLGGNHPYLEIHTANKTGKSLLLFKDSYANSFVPFLLPYFDTIYMIDPRYYYDDLSTMLSTHSVTDVLFLYSENTFAEDKMLADVLETAKVKNTNAPGQSK
ncbi:MAG: DHHW family protein [Eubacteriales bacterium]|nr:DHHW family protein [Eubacteriales bacterium]